MRKKQGGEEAATRDDSLTLHCFLSLLLCSSLRHLSAKRNEEGDLVGQFQGEEVIFPDLETTLEWTLSTPVDAHLFEEAPIIKMYEEESEDRRHEEQQQKH